MQAINVPKEPIRPNTLNKSNDLNDPNDNNNQNHLNELNDPNELNEPNDLSDLNDPNDLNDLKDPTRKLTYGINANDAEGLCRHPQAQEVEFYRTGIHCFCDCGHRRNGAAVHLHVDFHDSD